MNEPERQVFPPDVGIPNSRLPLLLYRAAVPADAAAIERLFAANGWANGWRESYRLRERTRRIKVSCTASCANASLPSRSCATRKAF